MILTLAKPAMAAFADDIKASNKCLERAKSDLGIPHSHKVNTDLTIDFGLQLIVRKKDLPNLGELEKTVASTTKQIPLAVHAPYDQDAAKDWRKSDLSYGREGVNQLIEVVKFADNIGATSVCIHPGGIRSVRRLRTRGFTPEKRRQYLQKVIDSAEEAQTYSKTAIVDLENLPLPITTDEADPIFTTTLVSFLDLARLANAGRTMTFDTCHYGIAKKAIDGAVSSPSEVTRDSLRKAKTYGYHPRDFEYQPTIAEAMTRLGNAIHHIHLNDGAPFLPVPETGEMDLSKQVSTTGRLQIYHEAYVPGNGILCDEYCVLPWIKQRQSAQERIFLTLEVEEPNNDYENNPRAHESIMNMAYAIMHNLAD